MKNEGMVEHRESDKGSSKRSWLLPLIRKTIIFKLLLKQTGKIILNIRKIQVPCVPCFVRCNQGLFVPFPIVANTFGHNFSPRKQSPRPHAQEIVTDGAGRSAIAFDEWMN